MTDNRLDSRQSSSDSYSKRLLQGNLSSSPNFMRGFSANTATSMQVRGFDTAAMRRGGSPRMMDSLNAMMMNQQSRPNLDMLEVDERCAHHAKDQHIAVDETTGEFGCNRCVFEKRIQKPLFIAGFARQTKTKFDELYELLYRYYMQSQEEYSAAAVQQTLNLAVTDFFGDIRRQLDEIERDIRMQMKQSVSYKELLIQANQLNSEFDEEFLQRLAQEKQMLDNKVDYARYGFVVNRKQYYLDLIKEMEEFTARIGDKLKGTEDLMNDALRVEPEKALINDRLYDILENSLKIDGMPIQRKYMPKEVPIFVTDEEQKVDSQPSAFRTPNDKIQGRTPVTKDTNPFHAAQDSEKKNGQILSQDDQVNEFYTIKENQLYRHKYLEGTSEKIYQVKYCHQPRVAFTQKGRVFLIGGVKDTASKEMINTTYEIQQKAGQQVQLIPRAPMEIARNSFACAVDNYGEIIYAIGGMENGQKALTACEAYIVEEDKWQALQPLPEARLSSSACIFNDEWIFLFGGYDKNKNMTNSIFRLNITDNANNWEIVNILLPSKVSSPGAYQVSLNEMMVFGGWDNVSQTNVYYLLSENENNFKVQTFQQIALQNADFFLFTGAWRADMKNEQVVFCGQDYLHLYREKDRTFETVRKLAD